MEEQPLRRTKVLWFNRDKGWGFLVDPDGGNDIFVHYKIIHQEDDKYKVLFENQPVEYRMTQTDRGPQATYVRALTESE